MGMAIIFKKEFSLKMRRLKVMASFAYHECPRRHSSALELFFQRRSILKLFKRLTLGYMVPGTSLNITQKARVLWQILSLLSQLMFRTRDVTILHILDMCSPHPLIVDCLLAPPTF